MLLLPHLETILEIEKCFSIHTQVVLKSSKNVVFVFDQNCVFEFKSHKYIKRKANTDSNNYKINYWAKPDSELRYIICTNFSKIFVSQINIQTNYWPKRTLCKFAQNKTRFLRANETLKQYTYLKEPRGLSN